LRRHGDGDDEDDEYRAKL
jgi:hypothetical protein